MNKWYYNKTLRNYVKNRKITVKNARIILKKIEKEEKEEKKKLI